MEDLLGAFGSVAESAAFEEDLKLVEWDPLQNMHFAIEVLLFVELRQQWSWFIFYVL